MALLATQFPSTSNTDFLMGTSNPEFCPDGNSKPDAVEYTIPPKDDPDDVDINVMAEIFAQDGTHLYIKYKYNMLITASTDGNQQRARSFAEEAAKKSQELTQGIASANLSGVVLEASKRSKELAAEASKKSKELAAEALKRADQITAQIPPAAVALTNLVDAAAQKGGIEAADLETYGISDDLREFVKGITMNTFQDFPLEGQLILEFPA
ncbi:hypothetical protein Sango_1734600 [Sesamum angolense]|uniref:Uncharacterized protein n=1 Tax=Sesamum angolense TaxID=2727404 RepID=A0AAE1WMJ0_9LAMI|nr:hypothetical protein Sango_1734600 [Sesamum angolense]